MIKKIVGLPGTGKTTYLADMIVKMLSDGTEPDEILFSSFSRATAKAIFEKLEALDLYRDDLPYFKTIHSLSAKVLRLHSKDMFVNEDDYLYFANYSGFEYSVSRVRSIADLEDMGYGVVGKEYYSVVGNVLYSWWQFVKRKHITNNRASNVIHARNDLQYSEMNTLKDTPTALIASRS